MRAGRPAISTEIKKLSGTMRKDRIREGIKFDPITEVPKPEAWLSQKAKVYFKNACQLLISKELLDNANIQLVLIMAQEFATYEMACRQLKKDSDFISETDKGYKQVSPWINIRNQAQKNYKDIASLFGMDPFSAAKIPGVKKPEKDPFDQLAKQYND